VLAIAAHPDDVEITCAGLLIRMAELGYKTGILDLTRGELGTRGSAEIRREEAAAAAQIMGLTLRENANLPDSRLTLDEASREIVAACIRRLRPTLVIVPAEGQRHPDHNAACSIAYAGIFAAGLANFPVDGPAHRPAQVLYTLWNAQQRPDLYVDITTQMERKLHAVAAYHSQFGALSPDGASANRDDIYSLLICEARVCGSRCGARYAEAYGLKQARLIQDPIRELRLHPV
jgi:bacillithiol biosynthesis deacetylase BshB1